MGEVYAAHDLVLDATVALKTLKPELETSSLAIERLRREIALARSVTDRHVCRVHDVGEHDGRVFLTMELLDGRTLSELVRSGPLPIADVTRIAAQLVAGLGALHRASIVHRDFKTSNVIVVGDGEAARAVITDFGLARSLVDDDHRLTIDATLIGTPAYMAPEQVEARPVTSAADVYALGVVLFELLTGDLPFREDTAMATATARLQRDPPRPSSRCDGIPERWDAIVLRCLERDPSRRPQIHEVLATTHRSRRWFVGAGLVASAMVGIAAWRTRSSEDNAAIPSGDELVAVLPVEGEGALREDALRLALTIDIHDALARAHVPLLAIYSHGTGLALGGAAHRIAESADPVAAALAVDRVTRVVRMRLVEHDAKRVSVALSLHGSRGQRQRRFTRARDEIPALLEDVTSAAADMLGVASPPMPGYAEVTGDIYERYGSALVALFTSRRAEPLEALCADVPAFAGGAAILAATWQAQAEQLETLDRSSALLSRAEEMVGRALAVDPDNALAHAVRGQISMLRWQWARAEADTRRAFELAPSHERAMQHHTLLLTLTGAFDEATRLAERKHACNPDAATGMASLAWHYYYARRFADVVRVAEPHVTSLIEVVNDLTTTTFLAVAYAELARFADAIAVADRLRSSPRIDNYDLATVVAVYALAGRRADAETLFARIAGSSALSQIALMRDALGDVDGALAALEKVVESRNFHALFLKIERVSPQLRAHPRYQALLSRIGLA